ncbi:DUF3276 family protein [bacterium SCSIO 12741]|nr:DUF3276 family protein [bacterium SCSIO 12741]
MEEKDSFDGSRQEEIYEKVVRAGKRTYFFDVRATRKKDYYLTITESKRKYDQDGSHFYQKHKIFLYKEDFEKFAEALGEAVKKIIKLNQESSHQIEDNVTSQFTDINFEDLDSAEATEPAAAEND